MQPQNTPQNSIFSSSQLKMDDNTIFYWRLILDRGWVYDQKVYIMKGGKRPISYSSLLASVKQVTGCSVEEITYSKKNLVEMVINNDEAVEFILKHEESYLTQNNKNLHEVTITVHAEGSQRADRCVALVTGASLMFFIHEYTTTITILLIAISVTVYLVSLTYSLVKKINT